MKGLKGRLLITPKNPNIKPFGYPVKDVHMLAGTEGWFCRVVHDGETYYYTGKTQETAKDSYHESIVTVLSEREVEY